MPRKLFFLIVVSVLVFSLILPGAFAYDRYSDNKRNDSFRATGIVSNVNYRSGEFDLKAGNDTYSIFARNANVQFENGRSASLSDLKNKVSIRIVGNYISLRSVKAITIIIPNGKDRYDRDDYRPNSEVRFDGYITSISPRKSEITVRSGSGDNYLLLTSSNTIIKNQKTRIYMRDLQENDKINVVGKLQGRKKVDTTYIEVQRRDGSPRDRDWRYNDKSNNNRYNDVEGVITYPASAFDRTITIKMGPIEKKIDVLKDAEVLKDRRTISVHDLRKNDWIRAYGSWDDGVLQARRIEVISNYSDRNYGSRDNYIQKLTGRIKNLDFNTTEIIVHDGSREIKVNAKYSSIKKDGYPRRFGDMHYNDRIEINGSYSGKTFKANSIKILS